MSEPRITTVKFFSLSGRLYELWTRRDLLMQLFVRDLKLKYKNSVLGIFWSLLSPILIVTIYTLVFSVIMRFRTTYPYPVFLLAAWLPWQFMQTSLVLSSTVLIEHGDLLNKIYFPRLYLPLSSLMTQLVNYLISLILFFIVREIFLSGYSTGILLFPVIVLLHVFFTFGVSLLLATGTVFFRDLRYLLDIFLLLWFFASPVIYGMEFVPDWLLSYYMLNPFAVFALLYRGVLLSPVLDPHIYWSLLAAAVWATGFLYMGIRVFHRNENALIKEL